MDKIIVTNRSALLAKYGATGLRELMTAVDAHIDADRARGIRSRLVFLDRAGPGRPAIDDAGDPRQNKAAVDRVHRSSAPDYLMILGAIDVIPHQDLRNPLHVPGDDDDKWAYGDLPYACDGPYSRDVAKFRGPTRVVGRLPDLTGARDPGHLVRLLRHAAAYRARPPAAYSSYFGLSTYSWRKSTQQTLTELFGHADALRMSPPTTARHSSRQLAPLVHFINCHGGDTDPTFTGQKGRRYPLALTSDGVRGKIRNGTVASVECCYGAQLYDAETLVLPMPICQRYLAAGAYGYFGSTTIAYGPAAGNAVADLITQYFLSAVLDGASIGRAALIARQRYVEQAGELDPYDLKTLAQFNLLGDPSVHPVRVDTLTAVPKGMDPHEAQRQKVHERRDKLALRGRFLEATKPTASRKAPGGRRTPAVQQALRNIAKLAGIGAKRKFTAFAVRHPAGQRRHVGKGAAAPATRYYVAVYRPKASKSHSIGAVAKEVAGRIVGYRIYEEKSWGTTTLARRASRD